MVCSNRLLNFRWEQQHCAACSAMPIVCFSFRLVWARTLLCSVSGTQIVSPSGNNAKKKIGIFEMARCCLCPSLQHLLCEHQQCVHSADCLRGRWGSSERDLFGCTSSGPTHVRHCHSATIHPHPSTGPLRARFLCLCPCLSALRSWPGSQPFGSRLCAVPRPNPGRLICGHPSGACTTLQPRGTRRPLRLLSPRSGVSIHAPLDGYVQHFQDSTID